MKEFFMMGVLCLINPITGKEHCAMLHEDPIIFYEKQTCIITADKKVNEIAVEMTEKGFYVTKIFMNCIVDKYKQNT
jgi:hypothetical protein